MTETFKTPMQTKIVAIWWDDICFDDNWDEEGGILVQPNESYTMGHVVSEDATFIRIGNSYDYRKDEWATVHAVPRGVITDMKVIYEPSE